MDRAAARNLLSSYLERPATALLGRAGLSPNAVTLLGLLVAGAGAYLLAAGYLAAGGVVVLLSGDGDFELLLAKIKQDYGVTTEVYGVPKLTALSLMDVACVYHPIESDLLM